MTEVSVWFERRFSFDFPDDLLPNLRVRLAGTPARLEELLAGVAPERLTQKPGEAWSIQEHAGHLLDLEELWSSRVADFAAGAEVLTAADLTNRRTHEANHNARPLGEMLAAFRRARGELERRLGELPPGSGGLKSRHPRLDQPMRLVDHLFFVAEHDDHHLARIRELLG